MKIDMHCHTFLSHDALGSLEDIGMWARRKGIDGVVITDHDRQGFTGIREIHGVKLVAGIELKTDYGHILGIKLEDPIDLERAKEDPIDRIHRAGGFAVIAHPFATGFRARLSYIDIDEFDGIEVINSAEYLMPRRSWAKAMRLAMLKGKAMTAGSDAHMPKCVGNAYIEIECEFDEIEYAIERVMNGEGNPIGSPTPISDRLRLIWMKLWGRIHGDIQAERIQDF